MMCAGAVTTIFARRHTTPNIHLALDPVSFPSFRPLPLPLTLLLHLPTQRPFLAHLLHGTLIPILG